MQTSPVLGKDRIVTIDIIRGFALFGIFLVNMPAFHSAEFMRQYYGRELEYTGFDYWLDLFFTLFIDMKFFTIFSFLFGLGFYIFMSRAEKKDLNMNILYLRRITGLLIIGSLHLVLLWFGDILHTYALTGFLLLLFYKRKIKTMIIWAFSLLFLINALMSIPLLLSEESLKYIDDTSVSSYNEKLVEYVNVYETAGFGEWVTYRFKTEIIPIMQNEILSMMPVLALFLFGLAAGKAGIFDPETKHIEFIRKIRTITFLVSIPLVIMLSLFKLDFIEVGLKQTFYIQLLTSLSGVTLCFFYISALTLLLKKDQWLKRLRPLGFVGQMALTNYLFQTFISLSLFVGLGYFEVVSLTVGTILAVVIFGGQIIISHYWLKNYQFGPFEWLWRAFTYGKFQSIKKKQPSSP